MLGVRCLNNHSTRDVASPCATTHLRNQLKRPLMRTKIREMHHAVGVEDANHPDFVEVEPLGNHLRPDKNMRIASFEIFKDRFMTFLPARRVAIHALAMRVREAELGLPYQFFCSLPDSLRSGRAACRTR